MDEEKYKECIELAKTLVEEQVEPFKTEAFKIILQNLLDDEFTNSESSKKSNISKKRSSRSKSTKNITAYDDEIDPEILKSIDVSQLSHVKSLEKTADKCIAILDFLSEKTPKNMSLTTDGLKTILADKFALTTITIHGISMALKNVTGKYVSRDKIVTNVTKYEYKILTEGKKYIKKTISELQKSS